MTYISYVAASKSFGSLSITILADNDYYSETASSRMPRGNSGTRFVSFGVVGTVGIFVHLLVLKGTLMTSAGFPLAQSVATFVSITSNFLLNNLFTYRDCRLAGLSAVRGLAIFYLICSIGALSNIGVASWLYANQRIWWLDGLLGSIVGAVWNVTLSNRFVWRA